MNKNNLTRDNNAAVFDGILVPFETDTAAPSYQLVLASRTIRLFHPSNREEIMSILIDGKPIGKSKVYRRLVDILFHKIYTRDIAKFFKEKGYPFPVEIANAIAKDTNIWNKLKKALKKEGYILDDGSWSKGSKSIYYSFGPLMDGITFSLSDTPITMDMPYYIQTKDINKQDKQPKIMKTVFDFSLTIDKDLLLKVFDKIAIKRNWSYPERIKQFNYLYEEFHCFYSICSTGRLFGGWSAVERELRGTFLIDGEPAVEVDICNAQPTLLTCLYTDKTTEEYLRLKKVVEGGKFYEWIMKHFGDDHHDKELRDEYKVEVMKFLCGQFTNRIRAFFDAKLPILLSIIIAKRDEHKDINPKDAHKVIGRELQRIESSIIVQMVCEKYPEVYSLHDGVICHPKIAQEVRDYIEEVLFETTGIRGKITMECKRDNLLKQLEENDAVIEEIPPMVEIPSTVESDEMSEESLLEYYRTCKPATPYTAA